MTPRIDATADYVELFRHKFALITDRMRLIRGLALEQRGRVFSRHVHSVEDLFGSAHFAKIESIAGMWESTSEAIAGFATRVLTALPAVDKLSRLLPGSPTGRLLLPARGGGR